MKASPSTFAAGAEAAAVETLYAQQAPWLFTRLRRKLRCAWDAADLTQSTFVRVLAAGSAAGVAEPRAYLTTIAQRLLANHLRRAQIERAYLDAIARAPEELAPSPETRLVAMETLLSIDRLLDGLPRAARRAFLLWRLEGLTQEQIAERLGISRTGVRRHLAEAARRCYFEQDEA